ncbi:MAG TPA: hypothetical protein VFQ88_07600 [Nevskiaceae bacterium]|nr:hypothetical protein [Nevskiaceae bacterium]
MHSKRDFDFVLGVIAGCPLAETLEWYDRVADPLEDDLGMGLPMDPYPELPVLMLLLGMALISSKECLAVYRSIDRAGGGDSNFTHELFMLGDMLIFAGIPPADAHTVFFETSQGDQEVSDAAIQADWEAKWAATELCRRFVLDVRAGRLDALTTSPSWPDWNEWFALQGDAEAVACRPIVDPRQMDLPVNGESRH